MMVTYPHALTECEECGAHYCMGCVGEECPNCKLQEVSFYAIELEKKLEAASMITEEENEFLDRILDAAYEFIDGVSDWGWDHPIPEDYRDPMSENEIIDAMKSIRRKLNLTGESAWNE